ncbi:MAG: ROK family protein [Paracoccaceae bacterium]|nr:ROK family protein [Paracoccaceae bacterium]
MKNRNTTEGLRHHNRSLVLKSLRRLGPSSHTDLAEDSALASGTVSVITAELFEEGAILKSDHPPSKSRGRPRVLLTLHPDFARLAFIHIASAEVEYSLINYNNVLLDQFKVQRHRAETNAPAFGAQVRKDLFGLAERSNLRPPEIAHISITTKGLVGGGGTKLLWSPTFGDNQINFAALFKPEWPNKVTVNNETCFLAHAKLEEAGQFTQKHAVLSLGDSIELGLASRSSAEETSYQAPPFGHMLHVSDGPLCRCGLQGCIEAYAGFYGILRCAFDTPTHHIPAKFIPKEQMDQLAAKARGGDQMIRFAFRQAADVLAIGLSRMMTIHGPMPVTIAGPGVAYFDLMQGQFKSYLEQNLRIRVSHMPRISIENNERQLVFASNAKVSLAAFDRDYVATRLVERTKSA